jgi:hypothetical protein
MAFAVVVPHLKCSRLQVAAWFTGFPDNARDRASAIEGRVARPLVGLPLAHKVAQTLMEELLVDDDVVGHGEGGRIPGSLRGGSSGERGVVEREELRARMERKSRE